VKDNTLTVRYHEKHRRLQGCIELHVERARTDRQTNGINHSTEEHARVIPFTATAAHTPTAHSIR
jgi:hypothetical protein